MRNTALTLTLIFAAACSGESERSPGPSAADAGAARDATARDSGAAADAGPADSGVVDAGEVDAGAAPTPPAAMVELRELDVVVFGGDAVASAVLARPTATLPESGCVRRAGNEHPMPAIGNITATGVTVTELVCVPDTGTGVEGQRCLGQGAAPPPIPGSTMDTGPWLDGRNVTFNTAGGADLSALEVSVTPPAGLELRAPTTLPIDVSSDLSIEWTPLGHTDVHVEVEVVVDGAWALVICAPEQDGQLTVPSSLLGDSILRVTAAEIAEVVVRDDRMRALSARVLRGRMLAE